MDMAFSFMILHMSKNTVRVVDMVEGGDGSVTQSFLRTHKRNICPDGNSQLFSKREKCKEVRYLCTKRESQVYHPISSPVMCKCLLNLLCICFFVSFGRHLFFNVTTPKASF